jgi:hypothetical protein
MSKSTKKVKVTRVSQAKLPSAESPQAKPAQASSAPTEPKSTPVAAQRSSTEVPKATAAPSVPKPQAAQPPRPNRVLLEIVKPGAQSVCVAGSFNEWKPETAPLSPAGNGRWVGDLVVKPGRYEYLFVVDGQWVPDPNAKEAVANPFGGHNSVLFVSA